MKDLRVNGKRLWDSLEEMGEFGGTPDGGCARLVGTDLDKQARDLFTEWCLAAGCESVSFDKFGLI